MTKAGCRVRARPTKMRKRVTYIGSRAGHAIVPSCPTTAMRNSEQGTVEMPGIQHPLPKNNLNMTNLRKKWLSAPTSIFVGVCSTSPTTLTCQDDQVKCLAVFGSNALKYAAEILATIEWGTQHWKLQEPFPVLPVPKWLCTPEQMQRMMPLRGELPLPSRVIHLRDIYVWGPALWAWMAILLQYWQDHVSAPLYGGESGRPASSPRY